MFKWFSTIFSLGAPVVSQEEKFPSLSHCKTTFTSGVTFTFMRTAHLVFVRFPMKHQIRIKRAIIIKSNKINITFTSRYLLPYGFRLPSRHATACRFSVVSKCGLYVSRNTCLSTILHLDFI